MRRQFFWLVTAVVLALIVHVSYVLFVPSRSLSAAIDQALGEDRPKGFSVLTQEAQVRLVPFSSADNIVGICRFNVARGAVKVTAELPEGFWTFAVYTIGGDQVYAINDTQADTNSFSVELTRDGGLLSKILGSGDDAISVTGDDLGWRIAMSEDKGLAVLWMAVADPLLRKEAEDVIRKSRCVEVNG